jgi:hypothetical protein
MDHKAKVSSLMSCFAIDTIRRGIDHDNSKLEEPEFKAFAKHSSEMVNHKFGTPEYNETKAKLGEALQHHYDNNDHHPNFFGEKDPVTKMNLFQIVEMFIDWIVSSEDNPNGFLGSLDYCAEKYEMSDQLKEIFTNTYHDWIA